MNKVLLIIDSLRAGGAQRQMVNLANGLIAKGYFVDLFIYHSDFHYRNELNNCINIIVYRKKFRLSVKLLFMLRKKMRGCKYCAVIAYLPIPSLYAEIAHLGLSSRLIVSERSCFSKRTPGIRILYWFHHLADKLIVNSNHQRKNIIALFPALINKTVTIYNGLNIQKCRIRTDGVRDEEPYRFIVLSTPVPSKNAFNLAKALSLIIKDTDKKIVIDWAGEYSHNEESFAEYQRVNTFLKENNIVNYWNWLGSVKNVNQILSPYNALIHPSLVEGLPNAICEALANGIPVLAGDIGDHETLVKRPAAGLLFKSEYPDDIAQTILDFISLCDEEKILMGKRGRAFAEKELNLDKMITDYIETFK